MTKNISASFKIFLVVLLCLLGVVKQQCAQHDCGFLKTEKERWMVHDLWISHFGLWLSWLISFLVMTTCFAIRIAATVLQQQQQYNTKGNNDALLWTRRCKNTWMNSVMTKCPFSYFKVVILNDLTDKDTTTSFITLAPSPPSRNWSWPSTCSYSWTGTSWQFPELEPIPRALTCSGRAVSEVGAALLPGTAPPFVLQPHTSHVGSHMHVKATHRGPLITPRCVRLWLTQTLNPWLRLAESRQRHNVLFSCNIETFNISKTLLNQHLQQHLTRADRNGTDRAGGKWASAHRCPHAAHVTTRTTTNTMRHGPFMNHSREGVRGQVILRNKDAGWIKK